MSKVNDTMNIMTIQSQNLYLQVDKIKEHLEMANTLQEVLSKAVDKYDFEVFKELKDLQDIIDQEKLEFTKGIELTKRYIIQQNEENMKLVIDFCKKSEHELYEKCMQNPILSFF